MKKINFTVLKLYVIKYALVIFESVFDSSFQEEIFGVFFPHIFDTRDLEDIQNVFNDIDLRKFDANILGDSPALGKGFIL